MERRRGVYSLLRRPNIYEGFQRLVGAEPAHKWLLHDHWGLEGFRGSVADIGCGPGSTFRLIPDSRYVGFDINADYIASARKQFGDRATFLLGDSRQVRSAPELRDMDVVICLGVLHHLDDQEAGEVVRLAREILRPGGRFLGIEPSYLIKQGRMSRMILNRDRGRNIRFQSAWDALLRLEFGQVESLVTTGLLRIPYTHFIYSAVKTDAS